MVDVKIKIFEGGRKPAYQRDGDCCLDCYAREEKTVFLHQRVQIPLGFALELPEEYEAQIRPRSGLSKKGVEVSLGTCDENFRGELQATVYNNSNEDFKVDVGDRVCQLAIRKAPKINLIVVDELSETNRGTNGWGSSGK